MTTRKEKNEVIDPTFITILGSWFDWGTDKTKLCLVNFKEKSEIPWWIAISSATVGLRVLVFPLRLRAWRNGQLLKLTTEHCNKSITPVLRSYYQLKKGIDEADKAKLFKKDVLKAHSNLSRLLSVSPWKSLSPLPLSIPLFLTTAAALRSIDFDGEGFWFWKNFGDAVGISAVPVALSNFIFIEFSRRQQQQSKQLYGKIPIYGPKSEIKILNENEQKDTQIQNSYSSVKKTIFKFIKTKLPFVIGHSLNFCSMLILTSVPCGVNLFILTSSIFSIFESVSLARSAKNDTSWLGSLIRKDFERRIRIIQQNSHILKD